MKLRLFLVDDNRLFRDGLAALLRAQGAIILAGALAVSVVARIADRAVRRGERHALQAVRLTKREREVVDLIAAGMSNKEIAQRLHLATHTIRSHVHDVLEKLVLRSRLQIAAYMHAKDPSQAGPQRFQPHG